ncbi:Exosome_complex RNA-binding protein Rrp4 [Hexamita inflata]|uniref:Exosome complex RNA-binding protein Rrp4 n=1 Tax=Hexamita inflata TaxID=28002 RepID=A0AA86U0Z6_9EUKA|nr:Exosome complex RNA-binding protein Rrp4 [Hexamita inflata]
MHVKSGDIFMAKQEISLVDQTLTRVNKRFVVSTPGDLVLNQSVLLQNSPYTQIYTPLPGQFIIGILQQCNSDGWIVDINTARNALLPKQYISKQALTENNLVYCKVLSANPGEQTVLKFEDATCSQLLISQGTLLNLSPNKCVNLSISNEIQLEIAKRVKFQLFIGVNGRAFLTGCTGFDQFTVRKGILMDKEEVQEWMVERERLRGKKVL